MGRSAPALCVAVYRTTGLLVSHRLAWRKDRCPPRGVSSTHATCVSHQAELAALFSHRRDAAEGVNSKLGNACRVERIQSQSQNSEPVTKRDFPCPLESCNLRSLGASEPRSYRRKSGVVDSSRCLIFHPPLFGSIRSKRMFSTTRCCLVWPPRPWVVSA